ncbi:MAG TPA: hypothetical protein PKC18_06570 [Lacipirellulaceae bacterium]|nr:hypothetical protein [Lacipirellulaceae bacterium]
MLLAETLSVRLGQRISAYIDANPITAATGDVSIRRVVARNHPGIAGFLRCAGQRAGRYPVGGG